ncbi:phospholipase A1-II 7 [Lolium perenne]|uniref:phospholipase A1-II 7 n=1 Tax=Lolium perenne TaxID=4522 RepID=UPI0021EAE2C2|nr:phospholipase A1-II 7-like [Lolium perenne]
MAHTVVPMSSPKAGAGSIATTWEKLQGSESWKGLLPSSDHPDSLDADLRASLIAYGELAEAAYDGLNAVKSSWDAGSPLYGHAGLLAASGVSHPEHYTVTKFLYATCDLRPWSGSSRSVSKALFVRQPKLSRAGPWWWQTNLIGYVAVATDDGVRALGRRDIVVAWRGSVKVSEFLKDGAFLYASAAEGLDLSADARFTGTNVHGGFLSVYKTNNPIENYRTSQTDIVIGTSARDEARDEVQRLVEKHRGEKTSITVTGHSLGAALAVLNAVDIVAHGINMPPASSKHLPTNPCPVTAILFACPQVGDDNFGRAFASLPQLRALHVKNAHDEVPNLPTGNFVDVATANLLIDTDRSPYLKPGTPLLTPIWYHNLQCYLHCLAGDQGTEKHFKLVVDRDIALVNKSTDRLREEYPVPAKWWVNANSYYKGKGVARFKLDYFEDI